ncbi:uncharacterized protein DS421_1g20630 [Arachis hypogaea]|nr:uncharacterized protein DS421_1g20630 [Arachis hypogaea]
MKQKQQGRSSEAEQGRSSEAEAEHGRRKDTSENGEAMKPRRGEKHELRFNGVSEWVRIDSTVEGGRAFFAL